MTKKVALLTDFSYPDSSYSLNIVAEEQLRMLLNGGYKPIGIVEEGFIPKRVWEEVELRYISRVRKSNNLNFYEGYRDAVGALRSDSKRVLDDIDVVITHDLIYQSAALCLNIAAREYAKTKPEKFWLNWVHSATPSQVWQTNRENLNTHFPNSKTVFPNEYSLPRIALNFNCEIDQVAFVPHPTDVCSFLGFSEYVTHFVTKRNILKSDYILVYPVRLDRGKQVEYVIRTGAALKREDKSVSVIIVDFHSTGGDKVAYRQEMKTLGIDLGLNEFELSFTSEFRKEWEGSIAREDVRSLMQLCNVFVMPSRSETYSLITQEAALCGSFLVLNQDFPPMRNIYGEKAVYRQFSSNINALTGQDGETNTGYDNVDAYFHDIALRVIYEVEQSNFVLAQQKRVRQTRNPDYVFQHYLKPLLYAGDK